MYGITYGCDIGAARLLAGALSTVAQTDDGDRVAGKADGYIDANDGGEESAKDAGETGGGLRVGP